MYTLSTAALAFAVVGLQRLFHNDPDMALVSLVGTSVCLTGAYVVKEIRNARRR